MSDCMVRTVKVMPLGWGGRFWGGVVCAMVVWMMVSESMSSVSRVSVFFISCVCGISGFVPRYLIYICGLYINCFLFFFMCLWKF